MVSFCLPHSHTLGKLCNLLATFALWDHNLQSWEENLERKRPTRTNNKKVKKQIEIIEF